MKPIKFKGSNVVFAKNQPEYLDLPAYKDEDGMKVVCCWKLSFWEKLVLLCTGKFYLSIMTFSRPLQPLLPSVINPVKEKK